MKLLILDSEILKYIDKKRKLYGACAVWFNININFMGHWAVLKLQEKEEDLIEMLLMKTGFIHTSMIRGGGYSVSIFFFFGYRIEILL